MSSSIFKGVSAPLIGAFGAFVVFIWLSAHVADRFYVGNQDIYCNDNGKSVPYCQYEGRLTGLYLNQEKTVTVTLKTPFSAEQLQQINYDPTDAKLNKVKIRYTDEDGNPLPMADSTYSLLSLAVVKEQYVRLHLRGMEDGYLLVDRVWLGEK